jgi:hypothetical protein
VSAKTAPANFPPAITGHVTDSEGAIIAKARVLIHWDPTSRRTSVTNDQIQDVSVLTDERGAYSVPVATGFYDVFVSAPAFTPVAAKVVVKEGHVGSAQRKALRRPSRIAGNRRHGSSGRALKHHLCNIAVMRSGAGPIRTPRRLH